VLTDVHWKFGSGYGAILGAERRRDPNHYIPKPSDFANYHHYQHMDVVVSVETETDANGNTVLKSFRPWTATRPPAASRAPGTST
jgi:hypothetical protein